MLASQRAANGPLKGAPGSPRSGVDWDAAQFFFIAVGYKVPWTAISSLLHQLNTHFQEPRILLYLNLAYFLPSLPAVLLNSGLQDALEARLGVAAAGTARFIVGMGSLMALALAFPTYCTSLPHLLGLTAAVGVAYSIAFGTSHQLAPQFNPRCTVALTTGFVCCGAVVLLADLVLKTHAAAITSPAVARLFQVVAVQTLIGLLSALLLLRRNWRRLRAAGDSSSSRQQHHVVGLLPSARPGIALGSSGRQLLLPRSSWEHGAQAAAGSGGLRHTSTSYQQQPYQPAPYGAPSSYTQQHYGGYPAPAYTGAGFTSTAVARGGWSGHHPGIPSHAAVGAAGPGGMDGGANTLGMDDASGKHRPKGRSRGLLAGLRARLAPLAQLLRLAWRIWPAAVALLLSVGSSMLAFPLFTYVATTGSLGERLPQVLFYSRLLGDILGRTVPPSWQLKSSKAVLMAACFKTKLLVLLVPAILNPSIIGGDLPLAALVALNWWLSGYINTAAYLLAPQLAVGAAGLPAADARLGGSRRGAPGKGHASGSSSWMGGADASRLRAKAGGLMAFVFQAACLLGLLCAGALQFMLHSPEHPYAVAAASAATAATAASMRLKHAAISAVRNGAAKAAVAVVDGVSARAGAAAPLLQAAGAAWNATGSAATAAAAAEAAGGAVAAAGGGSGGGVGAGVAAMAAAAAAVAASSPQAA